jgi:ribulose kinase
MADKSYFLGIDVGTASVRVGILTKPMSIEDEAIIESVTKPIDIYTPKEGFHEQSSQNIWQSLCDATKEVMQKARLKPEQIKGIGVDATCSLVVLDKSNQPISISTNQDPSHNIIMWMDHRALQQANRINATGIQQLHF